MHDGVGLESSDSTEKAVSRSLIAEFHAVRPGCWGGARGESEARIQVALKRVHKPWPNHERTQSLSVAIIQNDLKGRRTPNNGATDLSSKSGCRSFGGEAKAEV